MADNNDWLGYYALLVIDPEGEVTDELVKRRYKAEARQCYPGGGGEHPDPQRFEELTKAHDQLETAEGRRMYGQGLTVAGEPLPGGMSFVEQPPGNMAGDKEPFHFRQLLGKARDWWFDHRVKAGKSAIPLGYGWKGRLARYALGSLAVIVLGLVIYGLVRFWADIFDFIHAVEWVVGLLVKIIVLIIKFIGLIVKGIAVICHAIRVASHQSS